MPAGVQIKHKRKAGAFINGELAAGEFGVDVTNAVVYMSVNGTTVVALPSPSDISGKANVASPTFTGVPAAPTASPGTNTTQISTTAFVTAAINALIASSPGALDTLNELAAALGNDANFASTMTTALAGKAATSHTHAVNSLTGGTMSDATIIIDGGSI